MDWLLFAAGSAFFAGITAVLSKIGIEHVNSNLATALRTIVVLLFCWIMVFLVGSQDQIAAITPSTWLFLVLSGLATGASWLCYFKALQLADVTKVAPIDKSSTILTILLAFLIFHETVTVLKGIGVLLLLAGTLLMVGKPEKSQSSGPWLVYALLSAVFASLTAIFGKLGVTGIESNLATALRTIVVLAMAWLMVFVTHAQTGIHHIPKRSWTFLILSGVTTGLSWLCYYRALQTGPASVVVPIDKLSILITIVFSRIWLKEKLSRPAFMGCILLVAGTLAMAL